MTTTMREYYQCRERAERAAVKNAVDDRARHVHSVLAERYAAKLRERGLRIEVDRSNEKLGYKIRHWKTQKVPYILVVGKTEAADGTVNVNERGTEAKRTVPVDVFAAELQALVEARR